MNIKDKKMTVIGDIDPVMVLIKLRKFCHTEMVTIGPAKDPEKKDEPEKDEPNNAVDEKKKDSKDEVAQLALGILSTTSSAKLLL
ncbi:hypothetical protein HYC85_001230 [Camellia sinensis]|uniref:HMA domain-containing protein n=1 Tax=Camellia sinensis TaxID=4442 RepID=A0A7J7I637_CAMSI|nr:hypothetical protein HYC85_001230 [Camellia sinensis]